MRDRVAWARRVGGKRAAWRLKYEFLQRFDSVRLRGSSWPEPDEAPATRDWQRSLAATWPGQVAARVRSGEAGRVLGELLSWEEKRALAERMESMRVDGSWLLYEVLPRELGAPVDWLAHPDGSGRRWPLEPIASVWQTAPQMGDIKDIWEVGRCGWLLDLIRQRALDEDRVVWASMLAGQLEAFERAHQRRYLGPHFASGQECAIRALRWLLAAAVCMNDEGWREQDTQRVHRMLYAHGVWIARHLDFARHAVPNNHVIAEALSLWMLAECAPWWPESAGWQVRARRILREEITAQFSADGGYCQASHTYHRAAVEMLSWWWAASAHDPGVRGLIAQILERSVTHLHGWMSDPSRGMLPNFGANDGAHFHAFSSAAYEDFRPCLEVAHRCVDGTTSLFPEHGASLEAAYWIHGNQARLPAARALPEVIQGGESGLMGMRAGGWLVGLRTGPVWGTASQIDMGHVEVWRHGRSVACDRGSYRYHDARDFEALAGLSGHNLMRFIGEGFAVRRVGKFMLSAPTMREHKGARRGRLSWLHDGWGGVVRGFYLRDIEVCDDVVHVRDQMRARRRCHGVLRWQFAAPVALVSASPLRVRTRGVEVEVMASGGHIIGHRIEEQTRSRRYGHVLPMWVLEVDVEVASGVSCTVRTSFAEVE